MRFSTRAIRMGQRPDATTGSIIVPVYQTVNFVFDDVGRLSIDSRRLHFSGSKFAFTLADVGEPALVSQTWNSIAYLYATLAVVLMMVPIYLLYAAIGQVSRLWWSVPALPVLLILGVLIGRATKWMRVTGINSDGTACTCYFADGGAMGWGGMLGGTRRLLDSARSCLTSASS